MSLGFSSNSNELLRSRSIRNQKMDIKRTTTQNNASLLTGGGANRQLSNSNNSKFPSTSASSMMPFSLPRTSMSNNSKMASSSLLMKQAQQAQQQQKQLQSQQPSSSSSQLQSRQFSLPAPPTQQQRRGGQQSQSQPQTSQVQEEVNDVVKQQPSSQPQSQQHNIKYITADDAKNITIDIIKSILLPTFEQTDKVTSSKFAKLEESLKVLKLQQDLTDRKPLLVDYLKESSDALRAQLDKMQAELNSLRNDLNKKIDNVVVFSASKYASIDKLVASKNCTCTASVMHDNVPVFRTPDTKSHVEERCSVLQDVTVIMPHIKNKQGIWAEVKLVNNENGALTRGYMLIYGEKLSVEEFKIGYSECDAGEDGMPRVAENIRALIPPEESKWIPYLANFTT